MLFVVVQHACTMVVFEQRYSKQYCITCIVLFTEKIITLKEAIQEDGQRHLYTKSAITSGTTQYEWLVSMA